MSFLTKRVLSIQQQVAMELEHILSKNDPLEQYIGLIALLDRNETLFYRLLAENLERLTPITDILAIFCEEFCRCERWFLGLIVWLARFCIARMSDERPEQ